MIILYFITFANQNVFPVFRNLKFSFHFMFSVLFHPSSSSSDPPFTAARPHKWLWSGFGKKSITNKWPAGSQSAPSVRIRAWWVATNGGKQIHAGVAMKWQILAKRLCKRDRENNQLSVNGINVSFVHPEPQRQQQWQNRETTGGEEDYSASSTCQS